MPLKTMTNISLTRALKQFCPGRAILFRDESMMFIIFYLSKEL